VGLTLGISFWLYLLLTGKRASTDAPSP
jgi:hypothetical protein